MVLTTEQLSILDELVRQVFVYERVKDDEFNDVIDGRMFVTDALTAHNPAYAFSDLPAKEKPLVVFLARARLTEARISRLLQEFPVSALGGSADRSTPASQLQQHLSYLLTEYARVADAIGVEIGGENDTIFQGELIRTDRISDRTVPLDTQPLPPTPVLSIYKQGADYISLSWTVSETLHDFSSYSIYRGAAADLEDLTTLNDDTATFKGVINSASLIASIYDRRATYFKDSGLSAGTYYYVVVVEDDSDQIAVSNELPVTI